MTSTNGRLEYLEDELEYVRKSLREHKWDMDWHIYTPVLVRTLSRSADDVRETLQALLDYLGLEMQDEPAKKVLVKKVKNGKEN
jgi:hypothetical protein